MLEHQVMMFIICDCGLYWRDLWMKWDWWNVGLAWDSLLPIFPLPCIVELWRKKIVCCWIMKKNSLTNFNRIKKNSQLFPLFYISRNHSFWIPLSALISCVLENSKLVNKIPDWALNIFQLVINFNKFVTINLSTTVYKAFPLYFIEQLQRKAA